MEQFNESALFELYDAVSAESGVSLIELRGMLDDFSNRSRSSDDVQAYREGRKPWKKLRDEIVPVERFLSAAYSDQTIVRFPLNDQPPDAWVTVGDGPAVGIEVTGALARSSVEVAKWLADGGAAPGFIGLQDDAKQSAFDAARSRKRITHSRKGIEDSIDRSITDRLEAKDKEKFSGQILLITAPIGSSPGRDLSDMAARFKERAALLPFAQVVVIDGGIGKSLVQVK